MRIWVFVDIYSYKRLSTVAFILCAKYEKYRIHCPQASLERALQKSQVEKWVLGTHKTIYRMLFNCELWLLQLQISGENTLHFVAFRKTLKYINKSWINNCSFFRFCMLMLMLWTNIVEIIYSLILYRLFLFCLTRRGFIFISCILDKRVRANGGRI